MLNKANYLLVFLLISSGCARGIEVEDNGDDGGAGVPAFHICNQEEVDSDFWHCGGCTTSEENHVCNVDKADSCVAGICQCGTGVPCDLRIPNTVSDCRFGQCVRQDPAGAVCEYDHECAAGFVCVSGLCSFMSCVPEECDGVDNDCDGITDESDSGAPLIGWCLGDEERDASDMLLPPCKLGYHVCFNGVWGECLDEVAPRPEQGLLGCDGEDNNCDGCIDGEIINGFCEEIETVNLDIVFVLDISGSMDMNIQAMKDAVHDYSQMFPLNSAYRFGIVDIGISFGITDRPLMVQELTDFDTFETSLANVPVSGGGQEPQYDAVYELATGEMDIGWREGSTRVIIVFTDEEGQSYRVNHALFAVDEAAMCASLTHGEVLVFFTDLQFSADFDDCAMIFEVSDEKDPMLDDLPLVIQDPC